MSYEKYNYLVDLSTIAEILSVKKSYVRHMVFYRKIPFIKVGKLVRFDPAQVLESVLSHDTNVKGGNNE